MSADETTRLSYWRRVLEDAPVIELPPDPPRASREAQGRGAVRSEAPAEASIELIAAAVAALLMRYTRAADVVVGLARAQDEDVWPLRVSIGGADTASDVVARIQAASQERQSHALPLSTIVEDRDGATPFHVAIAASRHALKDVAVVVRVESDGFLTIDFDGRRYEPVTMHRVSHALTLLLDAMTRDRARPVHSLHMLGESDEREIVELGRGDTVRPPFIPVDARLREHARRQPDAAAIQHGTRVITYGELVIRATRLAARIRRHAPARNSRIGVFLERSPEVIIAELACWIAGHACVPFEARTPGDRVAQLLRQCDAALVLCSPKTAQGFDAPCPSEIFGEALDAELATESGDTPPHRWRPDEVVYIIFTSGSTGTPKGVRVPHGSFSSFIQYDMKVMGLAPDDRITHMCSVGFDAAMEEIWPGLAAGGTIVIVDDDLRLSPTKFVEWLAHENITRTGLAANLFEACASEDWTQTKLRRLGTGVEKIPPLATKFAFQVAHGYGPTETTIGATETLDIRSIEGSAPIGRPLDDVNIYLLDEDLRLVPWGAMGELFIGGAGVTLGYLDPERTAERFLPDPFADPGARMYRTGDVARWRPDRLLHFHGRVDTQLKLRGHRMEPGEIEAAILTHPDVAAAAVVQASGPSGPRLVAFAVPKRDKQLTTDALSTLLRSKLPPYMIPTTILLLEAMPLTSRSKTDRRALVALAAGAVRTSTLAPRTPDETAVAKVFGEVLGIDSVGAVDDFFALGGHSLLATKVVAALRRDLGVDLPVRLVFEAPTVEALARQVDHARRQGSRVDSDVEAEPPPIVRRDGGADAVASYAQDDLAGFERKRPPSPILIVDTRVVISGRVDIDAILCAVRATLQCHDALRTRVDVRGPRTRVALATVDEVSVELCDVRDAGDPEEKATKIAEDTRTPFELAGEIPVRIRIIRVADDRAHVLLVTHHIVADIPSLGMFARSVAAAYERALTGADATLEPPPVMYSDFAQWEREWFATGGSAHLERARRRLRDIPPIALPTDKPRGAVSLEAHERSHKLNRRELESIMAVARAETVTPYMLFLVATGALVRGYSGATLVPVGGPTDTRHRRPELARLVGRFLNVFTCVVDVSGNSTVRELLARVRPAALEALEQRDVPTGYVLGSESSFDCDLNRVMLNGPTFWAKPEPIVAREGLTIDRKDLPVLDGDRARNDLLLSAWATDEDLVLAARGSAALFEAARMQRVVDSFARILRACTPEARLSDLMALCE